MVKFEVNPRKVMKYTLIIASIFVIFPFLIVIGYYIRVFIEQRENTDIPKPIETSDSQQIEEETGVVVIN